MIKAYDIKTLKDYAKRYPDATVILHSPSQQSQVFTMQEMLAYIDENDTDIDYFEIQ